MNNKNNTNKRVAILSTGSEIISGDIQNTNSTYISKKLFQLKSSMAMLHNHQLSKKKNKKLKDS